LYTNGNGRVLTECVRWGFLLKRVNSGTAALAYPYPKVRNLYALKSKHRISKEKKIINTASIVRSKIFSGLGL
jgi:hypothetical protein